MNQRRATLAIVAGAIVLAAVFLVLKWRDSREFFEPRHLLSRFPVEDATVVSIDFAALRAGGFLAPSKNAAIEPDYKAFVEATGFDYRRDLDLVIATLGPSGNYFIAKGRFQWDRLQGYASTQGGSCYEKLCRMPGSTPERRISFLPLRDDAIAIGVSTNDLAATKLRAVGKLPETPVPGSPAWMLIPGSAIRRPGNLPPGVRMLLSSLNTAERVVIKVGPSASGIEMRLEAPCRTAADARTLVSQLKVTTAMLKEAVSHDKETATDDLAMLLTSGSFDQKDKQAFGRWPVPKGLLDSLTSGI